jgi:hypothetical protein
MSTELVFGLWTLGLWTWDLGLTWDLDLWPTVAATLRWMSLSSRPKTEDRSPKVQLITQYSSLPKR